MANVFGCLVSTPPKAASFACERRANAGAVDSSFALADRIGRAAVTCQPRDRRAFHQERATEQGEPKRLAFLCSTFPMRLRKKQRRFRRAAFALGRRS